MKYGIMKDVIVTESLSKIYKQVTAVSNISLNVRKGEIYGFLGLNGAGKTTTIRMLLGMINPSGGNAFINGKKISSGSTAIWKEVGYLVEIPYAYPDLTVRENLEIVRRLRFLTDNKAVDDIIDKLKLTKYSNFKTKTLSLGNAQRLGLAKALIHNPSVLIIDEPSNGLDPAGMLEIRELLSDLALNQDVTVFISSHILGEISKFTSRIGIIHEGELIQELNTNKLEELCQKRLILETSNNNKAIELLIANDFESEQLVESQIAISSNNAIVKPSLVANLIVSNGLELNSLHIVEEDLESYFLRVVKSQNN
jgi:ABC-2 type transport system ATP-binding protein